MVDQLININTLHIIVSCNVNIYYISNDVFTDVYNC